jgi:hypothetical protein
LHSIRGKLRLQSINWMQDCDRGVSLTNIWSLRISSWFFSCRRARAARVIFFPAISYSAEGFCLQLICWSRNSILAVNYWWISMIFCSLRYISSSLMRVSKVFRSASSNLGKYYRHRSLSCISAIWIIQ